jgi:hypothetical protein
MPDDGAERGLTLRDEHRRTHALLELVLAELRALRESLEDRRADEVELERIAELVGERSFLVSDLYAYAEDAGAAGAALRGALSRVSPKALGRGLARASRAIVVVADGRPGRDGQRWRLLRGFPDTKPQTREAPKLGDW